MFDFKQYFYPITIPPILPITIVFIAGIMGTKMNCTITTALWAIPLFFIFTLINKNKSFYHAHFFVFYCFVTFCGAYLHYKTINDYYSFYVPLENISFDITGTVINKSIFLNSYGKSLVITLSASSLSSFLCATPINNNIQIHCAAKESIEIGDNITFFNVQCKKPDNESFCHYQIKEQIAATIFAHKKQYQINGHTEWSLRRWIVNQKNRILTSLEKKMTPSCFLFFSSLFLGNRSYVKNMMELIEEQFKQWGIYHLLARSGMHLALFVFTWQMIFRFIPLPFVLKQSLMLMLCFVYGIFSWTSTPFLRSLALFTLNKMCLLTKTPYHLLHYLTFTGLCFLLFCPLYLFFLDFQLSFSLTFALAWLNQLYEQHFYAQESLKESNY